MEFHHQQLLKVCRLCGKRLTTAKGKRRTHSCMSNQQTILQTFGVDVQCDIPEMHPTSYCDPCHRVMQRQRQATQAGKTYSTQQNVYRWHEHDEPDCSVSKYKISKHNFINKNALNQHSLFIYSGL